MKSRASWCLPFPRDVPRCSTPSTWASIRCGRPSIPSGRLLIISDGGDNHSRYTEGEIKSTVKEADLLIYAIGIYDHVIATPEEQAGPALLSEITELTGGRAFTIDNPNDLADVATKIGIELRNQYVIGYRPKNRAHDGKWRKIRVKLIPPKGLPPLRVYAKTGYYAPSE